MYTNQMVELAKPFTQIYDTYFAPHANKQAKLVADLFEANIEFANKVKKTLEDSAKS